jgi:copper resistance protein B
VSAVRWALTGAVLAQALCLSCRSAEPAPDVMPDMANQAMSARMGMDDTATIGKVMLDQLELAGGSAATALAWDGQAWYGGDYDKVWLKTQGSPDPGNLDTSRNELLWDHAFTRWWDLQSGVRYDVGHGPARGWAAVGIEGLAAYWFDVEATVYAGEAGRTAARLRIEHDVLITQRLIVQPEVEANFYGKPDAAREVGSGLSDLQLGLRVRYEIRRELAPYVGVAWRRDLDAAARIARGSGAGADGLQWVAGLHVWL